MRVFSISVVLLLLSVVLLPSLNAQILKWVDKNGVTHYGDQPKGVKNFEEVEDNGLITYSKQSPYTSRKKSPRRSPARRLSTNTGQQKKQLRREGSSSSQKSASGSSSRY